MANLQLISLNESLVQPRESSFQCSTGLLV